MKSLPGLDLEKLREHAHLIFQSGLEAVDPVVAVKRVLTRQDNSLTIHNHVYDLSEIRRLFVIGAGKASAAMGKAVESLLDDRITDGRIVVKYGHDVPLNKIQVIEAGHPVPDNNGLEGAKSILTLLETTGPNDLVICLISGGGSALLPLPSKGLSLQDKQETTRVLLSCGATIHEINAVRKHLSDIKGGRLAAATYPTPLVSLILSDVVGDDLDVIASGPSVPDASTYGDCMDIIKKYNIVNKIPPAVSAHVQRGRQGKQPETPKMDDPAFETTRNIIVASNRDAIGAAQNAAQQLGYHTLVLSSMIQGETRDVAMVHAAIAKEVLKTGHPVQPPACILSGGETTVTFLKSGKGGRNQEFALSAALEIHRCGNLVVFSAGTDGNDGPTDAAGAIADATTVERAHALGLDPVTYLINHDAYPFFEQLADLVITGPTRTNVMDLRIMLIA